MIDPTGSTTATGGASQPAKKDSSILGKDDFLKLMMAQMRNQDPTSPQDPSQYTSQLATFSTLEQITNLASTTAASASNDYDQGAVALIGKSVSYVDDTGATRTGAVASVTFTSSGPTLTIGSDTGILPVTVTQVS
ncbi:MAG: flagellar hook capping protein [Conexibacter sp.]|jgi:flagellar basal-body rod modification protein FlgD|nr:flagellar hook capping protein [Conexibacter sp.]